MGRMTAKRGAGSDLAAMSRDEMARAVADIDKLQIPEIEKQQIKLQMMSDAGFINAEQLEKEGELSTDPMFREAQLSALSDLRERGKSGLTEEDRAMQNLMLRDVAAQEQAQQKGILQGMAERGTLDSGAQLAAQLSSQQGSYNRAYEQAQKNAIAASQAKREALAQAGNMAQGMEQTDLNRAQNERNYRQAIEQFNMQNRMSAQQANLGIRQGDVGLRNQEQMYNKELFQRDFENRRGKTQMLANARLGQATNLQKQAQAEAEAAQAEAAGNRELVFNSIKAAKEFEDGGMAYASDYEPTDLPITEFDRREQEQETDESRLLKELEMLYNNKLQNGGLAYRDGGCTTRAKDGSLMYESEGDIVGGDSYAGDRVDARLNSGEIVLNAPQQQRLMDVIRGREDLTALGDEDIIEGVPESYRNKLHGKQDKKQQMSKGFQRLLEMLGK